MIVSQSPFPVLALSTNPLDVGTLSKRKDSEEEGWWVEMGAQEGDEPVHKAYAGM